MKKAAKLYHKEYGSGGKWSDLFNKATRERAAKDFSKSWEADNLEGPKGLKEKHRDEIAARKKRARKKKARKKKATKKKTSKTNPARACARPAGRLTKAQRRKMPDRAYALPKTRKYPLYRKVEGKLVPSASHARSAIAYAKKNSRSGRLSEAQAKRIITKAEKVLVECKGKPLRGRKKPVVKRKTIAKRKKPAVKRKTTAKRKVPAKRKVARKPTKRNPAGPRMTASQITKLVTG
jgi:hypothetical protein